MVLKRKHKKLRLKKFKRQKNIVQTIKPDSKKREANYDIDRSIEGTDER